MFESEETRRKTLTTNQEIGVVVNEKNNDVAKIERIRNKLNVSIIIAIDYDEFEKICKKDNLQSFVFQYDNINVQITIVTVISNKKNEVIKISFKYHNYTDVFNKIDASKLFEHRSHDDAIETKDKFFFSYLFIICLLRNLKFFKNI